VAEYNNRSNPVKSIFSPGVPQGAVVLSGGIGGRVGWVEERDPPGAWWVSFLDPPYKPQIPLLHPFIGVQ